MERSLSSYIKNRFENTLKEELAGYLADQDTDNIHFGTEPDSGNVSYETINLVDLQNIDFYFFGDHLTQLRIWARGKALLLAEGFWTTEDGQCQNYRKYIEQYFSFDCAGDIPSKFSDFRVRRIIPGKQIPRYRHRIPESIVQYIKKESFDNWAKKYLQEYYPEALEEPVQIDVDEFARRVNLKVVCKGFEDQNIQGEIHFGSGEVFAYNNYVDCMFGDEEEAIPYEYGIAIIDSETYDSQHQGIARNTIIHECVHWIKDRWAILLLQMLENEAPELCCKVENHYPDQSQRFWIEYQARQIAPRILMPRKQFIQKANEFLTHLSVENPDKHESEYYSDLIAQLAEFFGVSQQSAKIRLEDTGFETAKGVRYYCDGEYVPPYSTSTGVFEPNHSYTLSYEELFAFVVENPYIGESILDGNYLYVEKHLVKNRPEYLEYKVDGDISLTRYARQNIDESCLAVYRYHSIPSTEAFYSGLPGDCFYRDLNSNYSFGIKPVANQEIENIPDEERFQRATEDINQLIKKLEACSSPCEQLQEARNWTGMSEAEVADGAYLSTRQLQRYLNGETKSPSLETILSICVSMHLPSEATELILEDFGFALSRRNDLHKDYLFLIRHCAEAGIATWNSCLAMKGHPPLAVQPA